MFFDFFCCFWHFIFNFVCLYLSKNSRNFYVFLFSGLEILSDNFGKSWNIFLKNIDIWHPKFFINSIVYCLFFFPAFWYSFFPISPIQTCQKILNIFVVLYCTNYRIYQRIYQIIFIKKNRDTLNTNIFRIPSFTICFFNFLVFLTSFFSILHVYGFQKKNCKIFVLFYCMDPRFYQKILENYKFFFQKRLKYLKSKFSTKFHRLVFLFYFFSIFGILFSISPIQTCPNIMEFFVVF